VISAAVSCLSGDPRDERGTPHARAKRRATPMNGIDITVKHDREVGTYSVEPHTPERKRGSLSKPARKDD